MNPFGVAELERMQAAQESAMQDTCVIQRYSRSFNTLGEPVETWTADGFTTPCGFQPTAELENRRRELTALHADATLRLPLRVSVDVKDRIQVLRRFMDVITAETFEIDGEPKRGPSGLVVYLKRREL